MNDLYGLYAPEPFLFDLVIKPVMMRRSKGGMVSKKKTKYSAELKQKALELLKSGETARQVCADLKIKYSTLLLWKKNSKQVVGKKSDRNVDRKQDTIDACWGQIADLELQLEMAVTFIRSLKCQLEHQKKSR